MFRNCSLEDISDGRLYGVNDMARLGCDGCKGCFVCCTGMGSSIVLDPLDVFRIRLNGGESIESLLRDKLELNIVDGVILPNIRMSGERGCCPYLDEEGRCSIHEYRPGMCRLFPLGRYYENGDYRYFMQKEQCRRTNRTKVKISKWLDIPDYPAYREYVLKWHSLLLSLSERLKAMQDSDVRQLELMLVNMFYIKVAAADEKEFMKEFDEKTVMLGKLLAQL
ncbi:MAG: YkgJ family cysteine cluster protein [Butyrivibrio sp.]|nr:YkgJ family cysteine cluster protein [Butyrivibrio sp.]